MGSRHLLSVLILECDWGADWPTWVPSHDWPDSGRTDYFPLDDVQLPARLRERLLAWQRAWEELCSPESDEEFEVEEEQWTRFVNHGRHLARDLQQELGTDVEVRLGVE